ncbi:MAG: efflux RND transporter periplasmic adaptor subunit [Myxococcota bacterium]
MRHWLVLGTVTLLIGGGIALRILLRELPEVDYVRVERGPVRELVTAVTQGTVSAKRLVALPIEVSSRVVRLPIAEGSEVRRGQVIAEFDDRDARQMVSIRRAQRDAASAQLALANTQLETAHREAKRGEQLTRQGAITQMQLDRLGDALAGAKGQATLAQANLRAADAALRQGELILERHRMVAPIDGVLIRLDLMVGELPKTIGLSLAAGLPLAAGMPNATGARSGGSSQTSAAIQILDPSSIYVEAQVDERDLDKIRTGQRVELTFDGLGRRVVGGDVTLIRPVVEVLADRSRHVTIHVAPQADVVPELRVGMGVDVEIVVAARDATLHLPPLLVMQRGGKHEVIVYDGGVAHTREVKIGLSNWRATEIRSGLDEGDTVLWPPEEGEVTDGQRVQLGRDRGGETERPSTTVAVEQQP